LIHCYNKPFAQQCSRFNFRPPYLSIAAYLTFEWGHAIPYWLRHYATRRKVKGSRPEEVNEFFQFS
jgi:hypothetical protein